jgi:hypothetical protein
VWGNEFLNKGLVLDVFWKQKRAVRIIYFRKPKKQSCRGIFKRLQILTMTSMYILRIVILARKNCMHQVNSNVHTYHTRQKHNLHRNRENEKSPIANSVKIYNNLPIELRQLEDKKFRNRVREWLMDKEFYCMDEYFAR